MFFIRGCFFLKKMLLTMKFFYYIGSNKSHRVKHIPGLAA